MVPLPCLRNGYTADSLAIADGRCSQWQQKEAAESEEVIDDLLPSSLEAAFGDTECRELDQRFGWYGTGTA